MSGKKGLRHGYTTGATASAAAKAAAVYLLSGKLPGPVELLLPWESPEARPVSFVPVNLEKGRGWASAGVIKDGGDDPDATHGMEIRAAVSLMESGSGPLVTIAGGEGVGTVTRPGLAIAPGNAAINPVPLAMIEKAVTEVIEAHGHPGRLKVEISAPEGAARAQKTMNARLGITGGISILGTTGIVVPMSTSAWTATIDACLDVALAAGSERALLAFGRTSERAGQKLYPELAGNAAVLMGDHVGYALDQSARRSMDIVIAGQFAKFLKVAAGNFKTHVRDSTLDLRLLEKLMLTAGFEEDFAASALRANTAREMYHILSNVGDRGLFTLLARETAETASGRISGKVAVEAVLFGYGGERLASFSVPGKGKRK